MLTERGDQCAARQSACTRCINAGNQEAQPLDGLPGWVTPRLYERHGRRSLYAVGNEAGAHPVLKQLIIPAQCSPQRAQHSPHGLRSRWHPTPPTHFRVCTMSTAVRSLTRFAGLSNAARRDSQVGGICSNTAAAVRSPFMRVSLIAKVETKAEAAYPVLQVGNNA